MKRVVADSRPATSQEYLIKSKDICLSHLDEVLDTLDEMCKSTGGTLQRSLSKAYTDIEDSYILLRDTINEFFGIESSTAISAESDDIPKGYYDDYYGQTAYEEWGDLVSKRCKGKIISKRASEAEEPGGLIYEAEQLGIEDFYELLQCLEGMCYNGKALEISDYQYKVM